MSMRIQEALSNCCTGVRDFASSAASKIGGAIKSASTVAADTMKKVATTVRPHFENLKTWAQENRQSIIIAAVSFAVGAIGTAIIYNVFCRGTAPAETIPATSITPDSVTAATTA